MRVATWNIRAGGGKRTEQIARVIHEEAPDLLVLTEFRATPGLRLLERLQSLSYHVLAGVPTGIQNCVCILSRWPVEEFDVSKCPASRHRWLAVNVPALDLVVLGVHVPNQTEIWNKREFLDCIEALATEKAGGRAIIIGDLNTALDEDCEGEKIRESVMLKRLFDSGWVDAWRACNPNTREFSWFSHRNNGFRLDQCLVSASLAGYVKSSALRHDVRLQKLSDHSYLAMELDLVPN
jgi:exodeoxyribonuclease-3